MKAFRYIDFYEKVDIYFGGSINIWFQDKSRMLVPNDSFEEVVAKVANAKVFAMSQEDFHIWIPKIHKIVDNMQPKLFIFSGTDITVENQVIQDLFELFPNVFFWSTNYIDYHKQCSILPLGAFQYEYIDSIQKNILFSITFMKPHSVDREYLFKIISTSLSLIKDTFPLLSYSDYNKILEASYFSLCPSGQGYDTYRFWECLCHKTIPIVKQNDFYIRLRHQYPKLPFLCIEEWNDLLSLKESLTVELYQSLWKDADISCCWFSYWESKLSEILNTP